MVSKLYTYISISALILLFSCNETSNSDNNNEQALQDYKTYVSQIEQDTARDKNSNEPDSIWIQRTNTLLVQHDSLQNQVITAKDYYSPEQQQEIEDLEKRFEAAREKLKAKQDEISKRYEMRKELLGLKVQADDLSVFTATDLAPVYTHFVNKVEANYKNYSYEEWQLIEGWWSALNSRTEQLNSELTANAQSEIKAAQNKYISIRKQAEIPAKPEA